MSMQDPIADMLIRIKNAQSSKHQDVMIPHSNFKEAIIIVLQKEGYVSDYVVREVRANIKEINVQLKYYAGQAVIRHMKRVSRPGLRIYRDSGALPTVYGGLGVAIVSTPQGVMTDRLAREKGIGGEVICLVA